MKTGSRLRIRWPTRSSMLQLGRRERAMGTMVTVEDVLGPAKPAPMTQLWGAGRMAVRALGSSVANQHQECSELKCATTNFWLRRYGTAAAAVLLVAAVCWAATIWVPHPAADIDSAKPVEGLTIFAVFFVAALAIERLLEPLSNALLPKAELAKGAHDAMKDARSKAVEYHRAADHRDDGAVAEADPAEANTAIQTAAAAVEALSVRELQRATAFWAIATCLGMLVAAAMNLYFMNTVGLTVGQRWQEILATGLIVGAGTKPLHDLVNLISSKSAGAAVGSG